MWNSEQGAGEKLREMLVKLSTSGRSVLIFNIIIQTIVSEMLSWPRHIADPILVIGF